MMRRTIAELEAFNGLFASLSTTPGVVRFGMSKTTTTKTKKTMKTGG